MTKIVKICGLKTEEAAVRAIESGADLLGVILVPNRDRTIDHNVAKKISNHVKLKRKSKRFQTVQEIFNFTENKSYTTANEYFEEISKLIIENGPFLVGVFRNQPIEEVYNIASDLNIDFIQLHGSENKSEYIEYNSDKRFGVLSRYVIPKDITLMKDTFEILKNKNGFALPLLDSEYGGEGKIIDWSILEDLGFGKFMLAGGLNPCNLVDTKSLSNLIGYDVSGGVEKQNGEKDLLKIEQFVAIGKSI